LIQSKAKLKNKKRSNAIEMQLFLNICLSPTYQLETLTRKGGIEKLSHPLLVFQ